MWTTTTSTKATTKKQPKHQKESEWVSEYCFGWDIMCHDLPCTRFVVGIFLLFFFSSVHWENRQWNIMILTANHNENQNE